jgi:ABC-type transporter Mla subunit MlaD
MAQQTDPAVLANSFITCGQALQTVTNEQATIAQELSHLGNTPILDNQQIMQQINGLSQTVANLSQTVTNLNQTVTDLSQTVTDLSQTVTDLSQIVANLSQTVANIDQRVAHIDQRVAHIDQRVTGLSQTVADSITANAAQFCNLKAMQRNQRVSESTQNLTPLFNIQTNTVIPSFPANLRMLMTNLSIAQIRNIITALTGVAPAPGMTISALRQELRKEIGCSEI